MAYAKFHEKCRCLKCENNWEGVYFNHFGDTIVECGDGLERLFCRCSVYEGDKHIPFKILYDGKFCKDFFPSDSFKTPEEMEAFYEEQERLEREEKEKDQENLDEDEEQKYKFLMFSQC